MFYKKQGSPEEGELVFCTVTNVQYNSVFVKLEEYPGKSALIHISEISPGRIRNIRDYVKEGKMVVCKIIKIDRRSGNIDVSLRRVTEMQKRQKNDERKQEQKAEKIIEALAKEINRPVKQVYEEVASVLLPKYDMTQYAFEDVVEKKQSLKSMGIKSEYADKLEALVREKIKPKSVVVAGVIKIKSYDENGIDIVKNALIAAENVSSSIDIRYLGSGQYAINIEAKEYKIAEKTLKEALSTCEETLKKDSSSEFIFERKEKVSKA